MTVPTLSYAAVTPVRDEAENLPRLAACLVAQTVAPTAWVIVDTGSTDATPRILRELGAQLPWVTTVSLSKGGGLDRGGPVVRAFQQGMQVLHPRPDLIAKVDADVSFDEDYFERLALAFERRSSLGIASGSCHEQEDGVWTPRYGTGSSVWCAARVYRAVCLDRVVPLEERMGWDGIDVLRANASGWHTEILVDLPFRHHRTEGIRDGGRHRKWIVEGRSAYFMGYRPSYLVARSIHRALADPFALAMLPAFVAARIRREPRFTDSTARRLLREQQRLRNLPLRGREALGRRST